MIIQLWITYLHYAKGYVNNADAVLRKKQWIGLLSCVGGVNTPGVMLVPKPIAGVAIITTDSFQYG